MPAVMALPPRLLTSRVVTQKDKTRELELHQVLSASATYFTRVLMPDQHRIISESGNILQAYALFLSLPAGCPEDIPRYLNYLGLT